MKLFAWSWSPFRLRGVHIRFHFSLLFSIPAAYFLFQPVDARSTIAAALWVAGLLISIFLHEAGHALAAQWAGVEVKSIVIWLLGGFTNLARKSEKPLHNLAISAAGPLVNMVLAFLCVLFFIGCSFFSISYSSNIPLFLWAQTINNLFFSLAFVNVILIVFNLLPIYPLDGGNILHALMERLFGKSNADLLTMLVSIPVLLILIAFGVFTRDYLLLVSCILIGLAVGTLNGTSLRWINLGINYLFRRSGYYYLQGDYERAAQIYTREIDKDPKQVNNYLARSACYLNMLQKEKALADIERTLKITPDHLVALQLRGEMYMLDKNYDAALELFSRAQAINPNWAVPYFDRGSVLLDQKQFQPALADLDKAISLLSQFPLFFVVRSLAHFALGNLDASHGDQDSALRLSEKDALVMTELNLDVYKDNLNWAEDYYARVLMKQSLSGYAFQGRADAYRANNEHEKAVADYARAIEINPREPRLYLGRGKCYQAINQPEKAAADFHHVAMVTDKLHLRRQADELLKVV